MAKDSSGEYELSLARILAGGKINESLTFDLELDLKQSSGVNENGGSLTDFVDTMILTKKWGENFSVIIGKQDPLLGGFEWIRPDADIYSTSSFNSKAAPANSIGLSVHYSVMGQTLSLVHLETAENLAANSSTTDKKVSGILLSNEFYEGIFSSRLSYHQTGTSLGDSDLWGGGIQLAKNFLLLQLDYLRAKNKKQGKNDSGGVVDAELETFVGYFRYNHENYQPFIKYSVDNSKGEYELSFDVSGARSQRTSLEFGVEFVPNKDEDMRYHIVYSMAQTKQKSSAQGTSFQKNENDTLFAGVKFGITLL